MLISWDFLQQSNKTSNLQINKEYYLPLPPKKQLWGEKEEEGELCMYITLGYLE